MNIIEIGRAIRNPNIKDFIQATKSDCEKPMLTTVIKKDMKNDIRSAIKLLNTRLKRLRLILIILIAPIAQIRLIVVSVIFKITILKGTLSRNTNESPYKRVNNLLISEAFRA